MFTKIWVVLETEPLNAITVNVTEGIFEGRLNGLSKLGSLEISHL